MTGGRAGDGAAKLFHAEGVKGRAGAQRAMCGRDNCRPFCEKRLAMAAELR